MSQEVYWDSKFQIRTLKPVLEDKGGVASPLAIGASSEVDIVSPTSSTGKTLSVTLYPDSAQTTTKVTIKVSLLGEAGVPEPGAYTINLPAEGHTIPLEGIETVKITNTEGSTRNVSFRYLMKED